MHNYQQIKNILDIYIYIYTFQKYSNQKYFFLRESKEANENDIVKNIKQFKIYKYINTILIKISMTS